jgi:hypothetical protein
VQKAPSNSVEVRLPVNPAADRSAGLLERIVHPLVIVGISVLIAATVFPDGLRLRDFGSEAASFATFVGGAAFLVLIAAFFQQQLQARRKRAEVDQHFVAASGEFSRMIHSLKARSSKQHSD